MVFGWFLVLKRFNGDLHRTTLMSLLAAYITISVILSFTLMMTNGGEQIPTPRFMEQITLNYSGLLSILIIGILIASALLAYLHIMPNRKTEAIEMMQRMLGKN